VIFSSVETPQNAKIASRVSQSLSLPAKFGKANASKYLGKKMRFEGSTFLKIL